MLTHLDPASALAVGLLIFALLMVVIFEATNGFHDAANAVATVIYTKSLGPTQAVVWSGIMNFVGVLVGGIAVAYALVELAARGGAFTAGRRAGRRHADRAVRGRAGLEYRHVVARRCRIRALIASSER